MEYQQPNSNYLFDRTYLNPFRRWWIDIDKIHFSIVIAIIIFGLMMTASSSPVIAKKIDVEKFFFLKKQIIFALVALFLIVSVSLLNEEKIKAISLIGLLIAILMLIMVLFFGSQTKGATRWISFFGFTVQPSELAKTFFIISNAFLLQRFYFDKWYIKYGSSLFLLMVMVLLLILQPDFGMTLSFTALWAIQLFLNGLPWLFICGLIFLGFMGAIGAYLTFPHVEDRINKFLDSSNKNYQAERSLDAFINGSFFGKGPGNGMVKKFIPDVHTDFIFSAIAEEYGILFCIFFILVFGYLITRIVKRAIEEENMFIYLSLCGLMLQFTMQVIVNIGVSLKLLPTKGMTLPFISYGGSSMIAMGICFGLILAFTKRKYHRNVDYGNTKLIV